MPVTATDAIAHAAAALRAAQRVVVFTGAGVSAESGLATFRSGANAMWTDERVASYPTPDGYRAHAPDAWRWYCMRHESAFRAAPNPAHVAIVEIERRVPEFLLVTQNVDGLHHRAGSRRVVELHGNIRQVRCFDCAAVVPWPALPAEPACARCSGLLRPDVVFFGEMLPAGAMESAHEAAARCDVLVSVGTSNLVWPAAELPALASRRGAHVVIVNPEMTGQLPAAARVHHLAGAAGAIMPALVAAAWPSS